MMIVMMMDGREGREESNGREESLAERTVLQRASSTRSV